MMRVLVPDELVACHLKWHGEAARPWLDAAPDLVAQCTERWGLRVDGSVTNGAVGLIVPVVNMDGIRAVLKLVPPYAGDTMGEAVALRAWNGNGAVRLLDSDPGTGSMLLERLDATSALVNVADDVEAFQILSELLARLDAMAAPFGVRRLSDFGAELLDRLPAVLMRPLPDSQRSVLVSCGAALKEVLPESGDRLLHGDLHFRNILAPESDDPREPWLAIDPWPLAGDPGFDLLPALHERWEDAVATGDVCRAVRRRFDLMTEVVGLDRDRAAAWTLGRVLESMFWDIESGDTLYSEADEIVALTLLVRRA
jgi:streptomycin 6-kinase